MAWGKAGSITNTSANDLMTLQSIPQNKTNLLIAHMIDATANGVQFSLQHNNDTGNNYAYRINTNGASESTAINTNYWYNYAGAGLTNTFHIFYLVNIASEEKLAISFTMSQGTAGAGNAPNRREFVYKWANTSDAISEIDNVNTHTGDFDTGSDMSLLGSELTPASAIAPETNSIFIETDTAKRYWFTGTGWGVPYISDAIIMGGQTSTVGFPNVSSSEEYNGTSWSSGGSLTGNRYNGGSGGTGSTSARYVQGYNDSPSPYPNSNRNEEYNGTSWSSDTVHPSSTNNKMYSGAGLTDDFIIGSGHRNGIGDINETYVWNGSTWTSKTALSTGSNSSWSGSSSSDNLITSTTSAWTWNGTSFTSSTATNTSRSKAWKSGTNSNDGFRASTSGNGNNTSEKWNGSSWTNTGDIPSTIGYATSCGSNGDSSIHVGGLQSQTTVVSTVYEFNVDVFRTNSSISTSKFYMGGAGQ